MGINVSFRGLRAMALCAVLIFPMTAFGADQNLTGDQIVKRCGFKYQGEDQKSKFIVTLIDKDKNEKKHVYLRLWKDFKGKDNILNKMLLFTTYPPDAKGVDFMRWAYTANVGKNADQWVYLPELRKIRRVTIRDPGDSFLGSDLTHADITPRALDQDTHRYLGIDRVRNLEFYVVEALPKEKNPLYSKRIEWYLKTPKWTDCARVKVEYYDTKGNVLKEQYTKWQRVKGAWLWDTLVVRNVQIHHMSVFKNREVEINTGLPADVFNQRTLRLGPNAIPGLSLESGSAGP
ncbi:MAG TPA: outer membrane lipoprotein-sorting protein [Pseudodesulfovibrio sp.]|nr:outer membrane lipoprotein-sorting protein [Pseudodesulfovibrio sp.]